MDNNSDNMKNSFSIADAIIISSIVLALASICTTILTIKNERNKK